jgi:hypothetical protein
MRGSKSRPPRFDPAQVGRIEAGLDCPAMNPSRRRFVVAALAAACVPARAQGQPEVEVWKSPTCGCCKDWVKHLEAAGFRVRVNDSGNTAARKRLGMPDALGSCHTALVGGYVLEGHVPAREVKRLLAERPTALGLSVPGMPIGSPGMDGPEYGGQRDRYEVLLVQRDGRTSVFARYA